MQVLLVNGSPHKNGNTGLALSMLDNFFQEKNIETKWFQIPNQPLRGCIGCNGCNGKNRCVFNDDPCNELIEDILQADGEVLCILPLQTVHCVLCWIEPFMQRVPEASFSKENSPLRLLPVLGREERRRSTDSIATLSPVK